MARPLHTSLAAQRARQHRRQMTVSEARLWATIKNKAAGARFRRQVAIGLWIVDFASLRPQLVIEVDDTSHEWRDETARTEFIEAAQGFAILRFTNERVAKELPEVFNTVERWVRILMETGSPPE